MYILNIARATKSCLSMKSETFKNVINELDFLRKTVIILNETLGKGNILLLANKLMEKIPDPCNSIDHLQEKNNKLVITEHQKSSHKLSKTEKLYNSSLYSDAKKIKTFLNEKKIKITKREHAFKGYASICNVKILNSFNPELHPKDTESAIKKKLKK